MTKKDFVIALETHFEGSGASFKLRYRGRQLYVLMDGAFDWICTSPTYGNRMADHHEARDTSRRNTYRHALGRSLHSDNSGAMQWGEQYKVFHIRAWLEARRVLKPDGVFVLNCKDHIRRGERVAVCAWHKDALTGMGFRLVEEVAVPCPSNRFGQNGGCRVSDEMVMKFERVIF